MPLTADDRVRHYVAQNNGGDLTPKQCRRIRKVQHRALSPHAGITRVSRLRKALERRERQQHRREAVMFMQAIRSGHMSALLSNLRGRR